jgi:hypothetical protein
MISPAREATIGRGRVWAKVVFAERAIKYPSAERRTFRRNPEKGDPAEAAPQNGLTNRLPARRRLVG